MGKEMTEVTPEYKFGARSKPPGVEWKRCPVCKLVYGFEEEGGKYLRVGKLKVKHIQAACGECGLEINWSSL